MKLKIDKGVTVPNLESRAKNISLTFDKMEQGDSFRADKATVKTARSVATTKGIKITARQEDKAYRVWLVKK